MPIAGPAQPTQPPTPPPPQLTPAEHAELAWAWLRASCAPSTWERFVASVAVREPQVRTWPT